MLANAVVHPFLYTHQTGMDARAPFDSSAIADIILCSSDNIHFHVLSAFLYFVSQDQTFRDSLSTGRGIVLGGIEEKGDPPIIEFFADSKTIYILLELIYPRVDEPQFPNLDVFRAVCSVAQFYSMSVVEDKLKKQILASQFTKTEPFRLYAIATLLGWGTVALAAARETLRIPLKELVFIDELQEISGAAFYRFLSYRFRCDSSPDVSKEDLMMPDLPERKTNGSGSATEVQGPFSTSPIGNLIIRSSDSVDFFVIEGLIRFVSPFFDRKFLLEKHEEVDGRPVITVPEDSTVLRYLLDFIYPGSEELNVSDFCLYRELVRAARKFEMSKVMERLQKQGIALASKEPLRMYAIATSLDLDEVAKAAACETLRRPLRDMTFVEELFQITGAQLFHLIRYRFKCSEAVRRVVKDINVHTAYASLRIQKTTSFSSGTASAVELLLAKLYQRLEDCPRGATYHAICASEVACRLGYHPSYCHISISAFEAMEKYRDELVAAIEEAVSKVPLTETLVDIQAEEKTPSIRMGEMGKTEEKTLPIKKGRKTAPTKKGKKGGKKTVGNTLELFSESEESESM